MKTLYINIDNGQIESTASIDVLNYNLLDDFFFYLGDAIVGDADLQVNKVALIKDFDTPDNASGFDKILKQWEVLKSILFGESPGGVYEIVLPNAYIDWLHYNSNDEYRKIYSLKYSDIGGNVVSIDVSDFYTCCVKGDLLRKIKSVVNRTNFNFINIKHQQFKITSKFVEEIKETIGRLCIETVILFYDEISLCGDLHKVKKDGRWGCIDKFGKEIIPLLYDEISLCGNLYKVNVGGRITFLNEKGESVYDELAKAFLSDSFCVRKNGKWGFVNSYGREIVPCLNDNIIKQECDVAYIKRDNKYALVNIKDGSVLLPFCNRYLFKRKEVGYSENWFNFEDDCLCVEKGENRRCVFIKNDGTLLTTDFIYEFGRPFSEGFAVVRRNGKYGFINKRGWEVISCRYDYAESFSAGFARVVFKKYGCDYYGVIDRNGKEIIPCDNKYVGKFHEGLCFVNLWYVNGGFVNQKGEKVTDYLEIDGYRPFQNGVGALRSFREGKFGFVDQTGNMITPFVYDCVRGFPYFDFPSIGHLTEVKKNGKYGCINNKGEEEIPCLFDDVGFANLLRSLFGENYKQIEKSNYDKDNFYGDDQ